jgi:hypothetical protein
MGIIIALGLPERHKVFMVQSEILGKVIDYFIKRN